MRLSTNLKETIAKIAIITSLGSFILKFTLFNGIVGTESIVTQRGITISEPTFMKYLFNLSVL